MRLPVFDGLARRLARDSLWIGAEIVASRGGMLLAMLIAARELGPHDFGGLVAVQGTLTLLASSVSYSMRLSAATELASTIRDAGRAEATLRALALTTLAGAALLTLTALALSGWLADAVLARADLQPALRAGALLVLLDCVGSAQLGALTGMGVASRAATSGIVGSLVLIAAVAAGIACDGLTGAVHGLLAGAAAGVLLRQVTLQRLLNERSMRLLGPVTRAEFGLVRNLTLPVFMMNLLWAPTTWLATVLLVRTADGYAEAGYLGAANQWFAALLFLPNVLGFSTLPMLASLQYGTEDYERARRLAVRSTLLASVPASAAIALCSPLLMSLYGHEYRAAWPTLALLALAAVPAALFSIQANVLTTAGRRARLVGSQFAWAATYLGVAAALLAAGWGAAALAAAMLMGNAVRVLAAGRAAP